MTVAFPPAPRVRTTPGYPVAVDAAAAHFLTMVGDLCDDARLARLPVEVVVGDETLVGVPTAHRADDGSRRELDDTGHAPELDIGGRLVRLADVVQITLRHPTEATGG